MTYLVLKSLHIIAFIAWMAALLYLPRLMVYHADAVKGGEVSETFKVMERRLLKVIMTPAMIIVWAAGLGLAAHRGFGVLLGEYWFVIKLVCVIALSASHIMMAGHVKKFATDANEKSARYFRFFNEIPTVLMIIIVLMVVIRPF